MLQLSPEQIRLLADAPVGRLSTADAGGAPHVIPVCFALEAGNDRAAIYIVLDRKPKRAALTRLRRVRNILENPRVALVVDHYDDDWAKLWYILITGAADLLEGAYSESQDVPNLLLSAHPDPVEGQPPQEGHEADMERRNAISLLRRKYPQYRDMDIEDNPVIRITPQRAIAWSYAPQASL